MVVLLGFFLIFVLFCLLTCLFFIICLGLCFFFLAGGGGLCFCIYFFSLFSNHAMQLAGSWFPRQELGLGLQGGSTELKILECWKVPDSGNINWHVLPGRNLF